MRAERPTVLLTLGRLPPAIDLARAFHSEGWRVIVADPFWLNMARTSNTVDRTHAVTAPAIDPEQFLKDLQTLINRYAVDLVVPVSEETPWVAQLKSRISTAIFCGAQEQVLQLHSKFDFIETAAQLGLRTPATKRCSDEAAQTLTRNGYVLKPEFSCSGRGVSLHEAGHPLQQDDSNILIQQRIQGREISACALISQGRCVAVSSYESLVRHGSVGVCFERIQHDGIEAWVSKLAIELNYTGMLSFDFIIDEEDQAWAIECNPRATSGLHFLRSEVILAAATGVEKAFANRYRDEGRLQEFWSHWTHWFSVIGDGKKRKRVGRLLRQARDITWDPKDPLVFLLATFSTWPIIWRAIKARTNFAEVLALDIEWRKT